MVLMPRASLALAACLALSSLPSAASLVTVQFGGSVTRSLVDGVSRGDRIVGYYTFDTAAVDIFENTPTTPVADGSGPRVGIYEQSTAAAFRVNDFVFITRFPTIADGYSGYYTKYGCAQGKLHDALLWSEAEANQKNRGVWDPQYKNEHLPVLSQWIGLDECRPNPLKGQHYCPAFEAEPSSPPVSSTSGI